MPESLQSPVQEKKSSAASSQQEAFSNNGYSSFTDLRSEVVSLKRIQAAADGNKRVNNIVQMQSRADASSSVGKLAQLQAMSNARQVNQFSQFNPIQRKANNTGLPDNLKTGIENLSGVPMDDVKVHKNSEKPAQLNAHAYAQGTDIHLGAGQEKHLPHEAWHVVQQSQGRVQPTTQMAGMDVNDNTGLEKEADVMGAKALQMKSIDSTTSKNAESQSNTQQNGVFQLVPKSATENPMEPEVDFEGREGISEGSVDEEVDFEGRKAISSLDELDEDLWFKSSDDMEDINATDIPLPNAEGIKVAFHTTTNKYAAGSILSRIDPRFHNPASRFGGGFYAATDLKTSYAEVAAHEFDNIKNKEPEKGLLSAVHTMEYAVSGGDLVDATSGVLAEMVKSKPKEIEKRVRLDKRDGIVFNSTKGSGKNLVLYKNYGMLKDKGGAQDATAGFEKYKSDTVNERMKGTNPGDISKGVSGSDMSETL